MEQILGQVLWFFVFIPLLAFISTLFWKNKQEKPIARIVQLTKIIYITASLVYAIIWFINGAIPVHEDLAILYQSDHFVFAIQFDYDHITAVYSVTGAILLFLVSTFSRYYMHRDEGFRRFFNTILFFALGYNLVIFSGNFETFFIGWEIIGLSSFLLIAFYRNRYLPVKNGLKVISIYRLSDIALILVMWLLHHLMQRNVSFSEFEAVSLAGADHSSMLVFIVLLILLAAMAKSAQLPFTSWLPRAMEGPTTSSAIFYGSLSVHIGIFLLLRAWPLYKDLLWVKILIIFIGACTGIVATLIARKQPTVKTQIAYSSAAQIGIIFIEVALGLHVLALIHFAGNAFLRTYQLLVSPSVLNYLVHHQYFHFSPNKARGNNKWLNTIYTLGIKEWNLDSFLFRYLWNPFKRLGNQFSFMAGRAGKIFLGILVFITACLLIAPGVMKPEWSKFLPVICAAIALMGILYAFASRRSAQEAWLILLTAQFFIIAAFVFNQNGLSTTILVMYVSGIMLAGIAGFIALRKIHLLDGDSKLDKFHGYVYEEKNTALLFLVAAVALLGFPVTAAFIGLDVFFSYIKEGQVILVILVALCFLFIELAAIRIYCRIFLGTHKKQYHPVAFRSS